MSLIVDALVLAHRGYAYAALQGAKGIDRHELEELLGGGGHVRALVDELILERHLYEMDAGHRVRAGRQLPRELRVPRLDTASSSR
jgi:hypothetical protein